MKKMNYLSRIFCAFLLCIGVFVTSCEEGGLVFDDNEQQQQESFKYTISTITPTSVVFTGTISEKVLPDFRVRVLCSTDEMVHEQTAKIAETIEVDRDGNFEIVVTRLSPNQSYYYVVNIENNGETYFGEKAVFSTIPLDVNIKLEGSSLVGVTNLTEMDKGVDYGCEYYLLSDSTELIKRVSMVDRSTPADGFRVFNVPPASRECYFRLYVTVNEEYYVYSEKINLASTRKYKSRSLLTTYCGTLCPYCKVIQVVLPELLEENLAGAVKYGDEFIMLSVYGWDLYGGGYIGCPTGLDNRNVFKSYPAYSIDNAEHYQHINSQGDTDIRRHLLEYLPLAEDLGIAINSSISGSQAEFNIKVTSTGTTSLFLEVIVVEDKVNARQRDDVGSEVMMEHPWVARKIVSESGGSDYGDPISLTKDIEQVSSYTVDIDQIWNQDNLYIYAVVMDAGGVVHNVAVCPINGTVDYEYIN